MAQPRPTSRKDLRVRLKNRNLDRSSCPSLVREGTREQPNETHTHTHTHTTAAAKDAEHKQAHATSSEARPGTVARSTWSHRSHTHLSETVAQASNDLTSAGICAEHRASTKSHTPSSSS
jgi:hypothetical protein